MTTDARAAHIRSRFLVIHDDCVALDARGPFRDVCLALTDVGADVHVVAANTPADGIALAQDVVSGGGYDAVLVAGRAGLLANAQAGLAAGHVPLGVLPFGDGEMISRSLGMRGKPRQVAALLCTSPAMSLPGLQLNGSPVHVMTSIGMDGDTLSSFSRYVCPCAPRRPASSSLASNLLRNVERFDVIVDGANYRCCAAFVLRAAGYGRTVAQGSEVVSSDNSLRIVLIEADDRAGLFDLSVGAKIGRFYKDKSVSVRTCSQVDVPAGQSLAVDVDGRTLTDGASALNALQMSVNTAPFSVITAIEIVDQLNVTNGAMAAA